MPLVINTVLKQTENKGIGLFSVDPIKKNQLVYYEDFNFEKIIPNEIFEKMPEVLKAFVFKYAGYHREKNIWVLSIDNARFINHSETPNTWYNRESGKLFSIRDIAANEELTENYRECCDICRDKLYFEVYP